MNSGTSDHDAVAAAMRRINKAWLDRRTEDLLPLFHPEIAMAFPGFGGRAAGRDEIIGGFADFCENATVHEFRESDLQVDTAGDVGVVSFVYEMVYEREGTRYRAIGRDLWVFSRRGVEWLAVWRAMLDVAEQAV
jgi:ketosteroid isomerase-like protein